MLCAATLKQRGSCSSMSERSLIRSQLSSVSRSDCCQNVSGTRLGKNYSRKMWLHLAREVDLVGFDVSRMAGVRIQHRQRRPHLCANAPT